MATFVDLADDDAGVPFVYQHVSNLLGKPQHKVASQLPKLAAQKKQVEAFNQFLSGCLDDLLDKAPPKDVDACWMVLCSALRRQLGKGEHGSYLEAVRNAAAKLSSNPDAAAKPALRIKLLTTLLNSVDPKSASAAHYDVYITILRYSRDCKRPDRIVKYASDVDTLLEEWKVDRTSERARTVYGLIYEILSMPATAAGQAQPSVSRAHQYHLKYLATFGSSTEKFDQSTIEHAVRAVIDAIKIPDIWQYDQLLELRPIVALKQDAARAKLYELLTIVAEKTLADYIQFYAQNKDYIDSLSGISHNDIVDKMRLLTLCTLAFSKHSVAYSSVANALQISEKDVEKWLIRAVNLKLVDAEMDQIASQVTFSRSTHRVFSRAQWELLSHRLDSWKESLRTLSQMVQTAKSEQHKRD